MNAKTKSCIYLQKAVYFAPNEIRSCCQRFFYKNRLKGDALLVSLKDVASVSYMNILEEKKKLIDSINDGKENQCTGCPHIKEADWTNIYDETVNIISIEDHSVCNMRCTYCSDVYYGGEQPKYEIKSIIQQFIVDDTLHVAWGGGEPTMRKDFDEFFSYITDNLRPRTQRVFTNALIYSPALQKVIDGGLASVTTSVDAGTEETFNRVRGAKKIERVFENLQKYGRNRPDLLTIKYIFTEDNCEISEVESFIQLIKYYNLEKCNFLISANFKYEILDVKNLKGIIWLYFSLYANGIIAVTFDDHIFNKIRLLNSKINQIIGESLENTSAVEIFKKLYFDFQIRSDEEIYIWGTGEFAKQLMSNRSDLNVICFVDSNENIHDSEFMGRKIKSPKILLDSDRKIVIASVNNYGEIIKLLMDMGVSKNRIVPNFII